MIKISTIALRAGSVFAVGVGLIVSMAAFTLLSIFGTNAFAQDVFTPKLAVINTMGEVWARDVSKNDVGAGAKLSGPGLFGGPDDQFVVAGTNEMYVITTSGEVWPKPLNKTSISNAEKLSGSLFGGSDTKYVLLAHECGRIMVINKKGEVWGHLISPAVEIGSKFNGPTLFGGDNDKYVVYDGNRDRILVINTQGEVWAHDLSSRAGRCGDTVGDGHKLDGPGLFGAPNDKYVVYSFGTSSLLVINTLGEVWARDVSESTIGPGVKLNGPTLFGGPNKYVVAYAVLEILTPH